MLIMAPHFHHRTHIKPPSRDFSHHILTDLRPLARQSARIMSSYAVETMFWYSKAEMGVHDN